VIKTGAISLRNTLEEHTMKALALYVILVTIGAFIAAGIGYSIETYMPPWTLSVFGFELRMLPPVWSLIVFLALFFINFAASWVAVIYIMDGSLKDADGRLAQQEIERAEPVSGRGRGPALPGS
jgi:hypothetical protein